MNEDLIQLPDVKDIHELLSAARNDIKELIKQDPESEPASKLLVKVMDIIEEKTASLKDLNKLDEKQKIEIAAYLQFLNQLLEDFFFADEEWEDGEEEEEEEEEEE